MTLWKRQQYNPGDRRDDARTPAGSEADIRGIIAPRGWGKSTQMAQQAIAYAMSELVVVHDRRRSFPVLKSGWPLENVKYWRTARDFFQAVRLTEDQHRDAAAAAAAARSGSRPTVVQIAALRRRNAAAAILARPDIHVIEGRPPLDWPEKEQEDEEGPAALMEYAVQGPVWPLTPSIEESRRLEAAGDSAAAVQRGLRLRIFIDELSDWGACASGSPQPPRALRKYLSQARHVHAALCWGTQYPTLAWLQLRTASATLSVGCFTSPADLDHLAKGCSVTAEQIEAIQRLDRYEMVEIVPGGGGQKIDDKTQPYIPAFLRAPPPPRQGRLL